MKKILLLFTIVSLGSIAALDQRLIDDAIRKNPGQKARIQSLAGEIKTYEKMRDREINKGFGKIDASYITDINQNITSLTSQIKQLGETGIEEDWYEL